MSELPPDRGRLLAIRTYLQLQLAQVDAALARLDQARPPRSADPTDPRPARQTGDPFASDIPRDDRLTGSPSASQPDNPVLQWWRLQPAMSTAATGKQPPTLHRGDCVGSSQWGGLNRQEALLALGEPNVQPCPRCRPDIGLRT